MNRISLNNILWMKRNGQYKTLALIMKYGTAILFCKMISNDIFMKL